MNSDSIIKIANELLSRKIMTLGELFDHPFSKVAISAAELLFGTSQRSIKYAKGCVAIAKRNDPAHGRWTFSVKCHQAKSKGPYDVRFRLIVGKGKETQGILGREVEISCNCNAWKYNGADFNALQKDYSERQYSNGQPARIRDPQRRYLICKHVAASIPIFKRFIIPQAFKKVTPEKPLNKNILKMIPPKLLKTLPKPLTKRPEVEKPKPFTKLPIKKIVQRPTLRQPAKPLGLRPPRNK
jgi:hypothetical protein